MKKRLYIAIICSYLLTTQGIAAQSKNSQVQDPTRPADYVGDEGANPWELNAVFISSERRVAVINGRSFQIGEEVGGEKIIAINPGSVTVGSDNGTMTLYLIDKTVKKRIHH